VRGGKEEEAWKWGGFTGCPGREAGEKGWLFFCFIY